MCNLDELNQLIREYSGRLIRYAGHILRDISSAQDAVQDAYVRYIRHIRNANVEKRAIDNLPAWMFRTTRNLCLDRLRAANTRNETSLDVETDSMTAFAVFESPASEADRSDRKSVLKTAIAEKLSPREQEVLTLKFEEDRSYREIAEITGVSVGHVGAILHRAMEKLRQYCAGSECGK